MSYDAAHAQALRELNEAKTEREQIQARVRELSDDKDNLVRALAKAQIELSEKDRLLAEAAERDTAHVSELAKFQRDVIEQANTIHGMEQRLDAALKSIRGFAQRGGYAPAMHWLEIHPEMAIWTAK